jgi:hypothetical protein
MKIAGCLADSLSKLDTDPLPLTTDGFAEIVHLGTYDVVDRFACAIDILAHRLRDFVNWK